MEQDVRFCRLDGRRIAVATVGEGPPLVFGGRWVTHLEEEWADPRARSFFLELARTRRVIRYDRIGAGLSDRTLDAPPTIESEARTLEVVLDEFADGRADVFACSCAGLATMYLASLAPERFRKIVFFGGYVARADIPDATRRSLVDFVHANWMLAAQMFAGLKLPHGSGDEIAALSRYQRAAAEAPVAAAFLELDLVSDASEIAPCVATPSLVLHRRGDRTVPIRHGRELAALLPNARFVALAGDSHLPWVDDQREVQRALAGFLHDDSRSRRTATRRSAAARRRCSA